MTRKMSVNSSGQRNCKRFLFSVRLKMLIHFGVLLMLMFLSVKLVEIYGFPFTRYRGELNQRESETFRNLNVFADLKKARLLRWVKERRDDAKALASSRVIQAEVSKVRAIIRESASPHMAWDALWTKVQKEDVYRNLAGHLNLVKATRDDVYEAIQIADAPTGIIMASTGSHDLGEAVPHRGSLDEAVNSGDIYVHFFQEASSKKVYLHIFYPLGISSLSVESEDRVPAVLILLINVDVIIKPLLYTGDALGQSGEALLIDQELSTLTSLKHPLPDDGTIAGPLESSSPLKQRTLAIQGQEGIMVSRDYRDVPVLAAYRHIRITPDLTWGLIVKVDRAEVFAPLHRRLVFSSSVGIISLFIAIGLTFLLATTISRPIRLLCKTAQYVEAGDLSARVPITTPDEVGFLAGTFNSMIQRIQNWHRELEEQVETRTAQLSLKNQELANEINERKRFEEALKEERDRAQNYLDIAAVLLLIIDADQRVRLINKKGCEILGYREEELVGRNWFDRCVPEKNRARLKDSFNMVMSGEIELVESFEHPILNKNGQERILAWHNVVLRNEQGKIQATLSSGEDIDESKRAEARLRDAEERYRTLFEQSPNSVVIIDPETALSLEFNSAAHQKLGYTREEFARLRITDYEALETPEETRMHIEKVLRHGFDEFETKHRTKTGEIIDVLIRVKTINLSGRAVFLGIFHDISEQKRIEKALKEERDRVQRYVDIAGVMLIVLSADETVQLINNKGCEILGCSKEEILGKNWFDSFIPDRNRSQVLEYFQKLISGQTEVVEYYENPVLTRRGEERLIAWSNVFLKDEEGRIYATLSSGEDITESRRSEEELKQMTEELKRSNTELQQFAYVVSHDLQEPLLTVSGYCQLLQRRCKGKLDREAEKFIHFAVDGAAKMQVLIKDLLGYSRVGAGEKNFKLIDCSTVVAQAVANLRAVIDETGAMITYDSLPTIMVNGSQFIQLFQNLLGNAIKFHRDEQPRVHISACDKGSEWLFSVRDNGIGIDPNYSQRIFVIFNRLHNPAEYPGTGIGLATCKKIVERHGGRIWVDSEPGKGSTFYFSLPKK